MIKTDCDIAIGFSIPLKRKSRSNGFGIVYLLVCIFVFFRQGEGKLNVRLYRANSVDEFIVPFRGKGEDGKLFAEKYRQLLVVRVQFQLRYVLDGEF